MSTDEPLKQPGNGNSGVQAATQTVRSEAVTSAAPVSRILVEHVEKAYVTRGLWPLVRRNRVLTDASLEIGAGEIAQVLIEDHIRGRVADGVRSGDGNSHIGEVMEVIPHYARS